MLYAPNFLRGGIKNRVTIPCDYHQSEWQKQHEKIAYLKPVPVIKMSIDVITEKTTTTDLRFSVGSTSSSISITTPNVSHFPASVATVKEDGVEHSLVYVW